MELKAALLDSSRGREKPAEASPSQGAIGARASRPEQAETARADTTRLILDSAEGSMVRKLIEWALDNPLVVILLAIFLAAIGVISFLNVNVEAYPDPAPAIVEVVAQFPGASAEEVERQVTIPLEVTFAGMPGLKYIHSKSLFGLSDLKMNWHYGSEYTYQTARQEVINRMATIRQPLPPNVTPAISPESPTGEIYRYILKVPKDAAGQRHLHAQRHQGAAGLGAGARVPHRAAHRGRHQLRRHGPALRGPARPGPPAPLRHHAPQLQTTLANSNATVGGDYVNQGQVAMTVRSVGLFGGGVDPVNKVLGLQEPVAAAAMLRAEELRRIRDIRSLVITSVNNQPIRVEDVVEGGRLCSGTVARRTGRGRQQPDAPGADRLLECRPRAAVGLAPLASPTSATTRTTR